MRPIVARTTAAIGTEAAGPPPTRVHTRNAVYIASMTKSPWAKLITFIMPQIRVRPEENSAYTAPMSRPLTMICSRVDDMGWGACQAVLSFTLPPPAGRPLAGRVAARLRAAGWGSCDVARSCQFLRPPTPTLPRSRRSGRKGGGSRPRRVQALSYQPLYGRCSSPAAFSFGQTGTYLP